jgi:two-component system chemotaxis response regulator CheY
MTRTDFSAYRILVVGAKTHPIHLLRSVMAIAGISKIVHVENGQKGLELLGTDQFHAVFCDRYADASDSVPFVVAARRDQSALNPMIPIFLLKERASRPDVEQARDTGATDVLTVPISPKSLIAKLQAAIHAPRPFIVASEFFGPDRRSKARPSYYGSDRRKLMPRKTKVDFTHI